MGREPVTWIRFSHMSIQHFLATQSIVNRWKQKGNPIEKVEDLFCNERWHDLVGFFAEQFCQPLSINMAASSIDHVERIPLVLKISQHVHALAFSNIGIGQSRAIVVSLSSALSYNRSLQTLDMRSTGLGSECIRLLCEPLKSHRELKNLYLKDNHIGRVGAIYIAEMLKINQSISVLDLGDNTIGDGAEALAHALSFNVALTSLDLRRNNITKLACEYLATMVKQHGLVIVEMQHNQHGVPDKLTATTTFEFEHQSSQLPLALRTPRHNSSEMKESDGMLTTPRSSHNVMLPPIEVRTTDSKASNSMIKYR